MRYTDIDKNIDRIKNSIKRMRDIIKYELDSIEQIAMAKDMIRALAEDYKYYYEIKQVVAF